MKKSFFTGKELDGPLELAPGRVIPARQVEYDIAADNILSLEQMLRRCTYIADLKLIVIKSRAYLGPAVYSVARLAHYRAFQTGNIDDQGRNIVDVWFAHPDRKTEYSVAAAGVTK